MPDDISLFDAIYTTRAIRKFTAEPVPDELLRKILDAAGQAPSGGNRQPWRFIVIRREEGRAKLRELLAIADKNSNGSGAGVALADAPVIVIVCAVRPAATGAHTVGPFGQTYPAVENLLLAARAVGLGSTITTAFKWADAEFRDWLGLPENIDATCLMPLGYPDLAQGERHSRKTRQPLEEVAFEEHWGESIRF